MEPKENIKVNEANSRNDEKVNGNDDDDYAEDEKFYSINYYMIPAKVTYFFNGASIQIDSFLMMFFVSIGFNPAEAGLIAGLQYIGGIIGAPAWGFVADKLSMHRVLIMILCVMAVVTTCLQPILGIYFGNKNTFKCRFKMNNTLHTDDGDFSDSVEYNTLFYSFLFIAILGKSFDASVTSFVDSGCLHRIQTSSKKTNYGHQKYIRSFGVGFGGMVYSIAVNFYPNSSITSCETGIFITYAGLLVFLAISCNYLFKGFANKEDEEKDLLPIIKRTLINIDTLFFFTTVLFGGIARSMFFNFLYLRLRELNTMPLLFGLQACIVAISGSIFSYFSTKIINILGGTVNTMCFSCFAWSFRFLCVSFLTNPYYIFPIETLHGLTSSLFLNSAFVHLSEISDPSILTVMTGKLNSLYVQLGSLIANMVGGKLYYVFGGHNLFLLSSALYGVWGVVILSYVIFRCLRDERYELLSNEDTDEGTYTPCNVD